VTYFKLFLNSEKLLIAVFFLFTLLFFIINSPVKPPVAISDDMIELFNSKTVDIPIQLCLYSNSM